MNKTTASLLSALFLMGFSTGIFAVADEKEGGAVMKLTSPSFKNNEKMPAKFTCDGEGVNPALRIENLPEGTKSLALIVDDPDASMKTWVHWVVYDIPPSGYIEEDSIPGKQGINDSGGKDYSGPLPPSGTHRYYFKIYALDKVLGLNDGISKKDLEKAMQRSILSSAELIGLYNRDNRKR
ncbi:MAG: YbhB/YbcL family Raf kinase inhibitor-like protein [Candidatus Omnitrophica bacterium]|nr:YbhB/YbcL family Raf kinase inhibitor-like protein [Candidatus Omnitrophota bacterium]